MDLWQRLELNDQTEGAALEKFLILDAELDGIEPATNENGPVLEPEIRMETNSVEEVEPEIRMETEEDQVELARINMEEIHIRENELQMFRMDLRIDVFEEEPPENERSLDLIGKFSSRPIESNLSAF